MSHTHTSGCDWPSVTQHKHSIICYIIWLHLHMCIPRPLCPFTTGHMSLTILLLHKRPPHPYIHTLPPYPYIYLHLVHIQIPSHAILRKVATHRYLRKECNTSKGNQLGTQTYLIRTQIIIIMQFRKMHSTTCISSHCPANTVRLITTAP